jgi:hypothetical protein
MVIGAALDVWPADQATRAWPAGWGGGSMDLRPGALVASQLHRHHAAS